MTDPVMDLDSLPFPDYDDFFEQHAAIFGSMEDVLMPIESSRGCWWGQKCHCTFCGQNGGTMNYRAKSPERFLAEVEELAGRYRVRNLAAADNILDMTYFGSVLPRLKEKGLDLNLMYETKANLKEYQVRLLAECGIRQIQPGIESLSTNVLKLMRKGVHACQNVRLLRWCAEYLVQPAWNLLAGFPHENPDDYRAQTDLIPFLVHLAPPTGVTPVRIDRFSPLFVSGEKLGALRIRPVAAYSHVYPLDDAERKDLAYFFDCDYPPDQNLSAYVPKFKEAVDAWIAGADVGKLIALDDDVTLAVCDGRRDARRRDYQLTGWRRLLYASCNDGRTMRQIEGVLVEAGHESVPAREIRNFLAELIDARLLLYVDECYLSLAIRGDHHFRLIAQHLSRGEEAQAFCILRPSGCSSFIRHDSRSTWRAT